MPTYQYQCTACQEGLEVVQKFTDDALTECPSCQGRLKKVFSAVGIVFKGSGFYRNDSRNASSGGGSSSSTSEKSTAEKSTAKKSENGSSSSSSSPSSSSSSSTSSSSSSSSSSTSTPSAA